VSAQQLLQPFCAVDDIRVYLRRIFRKDGHLYATNGAVLVSVADDSSVETDPDNDARCPNNVELIISREKCAGVGFIPLRFDEPKEKKPCTGCGGSGKIFKSNACPCCDDGEFIHEGHRYECKECDGEGRVEATSGETDTCEDCKGSGVSDTQPVVLPDGRTFGLAHLNKLMALPGIEYLPEQIDDSSNIMRFRFAGGIGALMSIRT